MMKKYFSLLVLLSLSAFVFAQAKDSTLTKKEFLNEISKLSNRVRVIEKLQAELQKANVFHEVKIDSLNNQLSVAQANVKQIADSLNITVASVSNTDKTTKKSIHDINQTISSRTLYWTIAILSVALLSLIVFLVLKNNLTVNRRNLDLQIAATNKAMQNEAIKLDSKLVDILQTQLSILKEERKSTSIASNGTDHKLPLKVGEEIHRMRKRIENMPSDIKGLTALKNSLERLEEQFNESGYEIEELLGKKYVDGLKVEARFVDNPDLPKGEEIITDVLRPQIMYKGSVIQVAKVEVGKSY